MRMSCNGCRVLRKGCSEECSIRPCLQWIKSPECQSNATVFLAKFYGRAGLLNLIHAGPHHLRPAIFRSLLYEACGRIVNPIYGSVGLLWSGQWQLCQNAVEAVLKGAPITPIATEEAASQPPFKGGYDIRHVTKQQEDDDNSNSARVKPTRTRFKRPGGGGVVKPKPTKVVSSAAAALAMMSTATAAELNGSSTSHDSSTSHSDEVTTEDSSMVSVEETEPAGAKADVEELRNGGGNDDGELELELTLGFGLGLGLDPRGRGSEPKACLDTIASRVKDNGPCKMELGLE